MMAHLCVYQKKHDGHRQFFFYFLWNDGTSRLKIMFILLFSGRNEITRKLSALANWLAFAQVAASTCDDQVTTNIIKSYYLDFLNWGWTCGPDGEEGMTCLGSTDSQKVRHVYFSSGTGFVAYLVDRVPHCIALYNSNTDSTWNLP